MPKTVAARCTRLACGHEWRTTKAVAPFRCPHCKQVTGQARPLKTSKFRNKRTVVDGICFDSKKEARRWVELKALEAAGEIAALRRQVRFPLEVNGALVCTYVCDFQYETPPWTGHGGTVVTEDAKGKRTDVYLLKRKLMRACHGIEIRET